MHRHEKNFSMMLTKLKCLHIHCRCFGNGVGEQQACSLLKASIAWSQEDGIIHRMRVYFRKPWFQEEVWMFVWPCIRRKKTKGNALHACGFRPNQSISYHCHKSNRSVIDMLVSRTRNYKSLGSIYFVY